MTCKICNQPTISFYDDIMQSNFFHCNSCEFIFKDEINYVSLKEELQQYKNHNNSFESAGYVKMFQDFIDLTILPYKQNIRTALEFGSGPGPVLAELLKQEGFDVDIYDKFFSSEKVYQNKRYDLISSTEVIEHIDNPLELFTFFKNHISTNGYLALMTQFHDNTQSGFLKWWYRKDPTHITFYRPHTFKILAKKFNFDLITCDNKKIVLLRHHG